MTSKPGGTPVDRGAADANAGLSAGIGHTALKVFTEYDVDVVSPSSVVGEVRDYLPEPGERYDISVEALESQLRLLAIRDTSAKHIKRSSSRRNHEWERGTLTTSIFSPWRRSLKSSDSDFKGAGVELYTTARLLKLLAKRRL